MKEVLEPLALIPGVRLAVLISVDGVPIELIEGEAETTRRIEGGHSFATHEGRMFFAGLAAGWLGDLSRAVGPLSWDAPSRVVMKCERGAVVMHRCPSGVLLVVLEHGVTVDEIRVPMEGAVGRMQRVLRGMARASEAAAEAASLAKTPGIFPATNSVPAQLEAPEPSTDQISGSSGPESLR